MERRGGRERRKYIDPRYRSAAYPEFVDKRDADRRRPPYEDVPPLIKEHPIRRWKVLIGVLIAVFLICIFFFTNLILSRKFPYDTVRKRTITLGYHQDESVKLEGKGIPRQNLLGLHGASIMSDIWWCS
jgi:hypothetical protein